MLCNKLLSFRQANKMRHLIMQNYFLKTTNRHFSSSASNSLQGQPLIDHLNARLQNLSKSSDFKEDFLYVKSRLNQENPTSKEALTSLNKFNDFKNDKTDFFPQSDIDLLLNQILPNTPK